MSNHIFLGVDTSNYTTSLAVVDDEGCLQADQRQVLHVDNNKRGLRQSEAFFQHVGNLPDLVGQLVRQLPSRSLQGVAAVAATTKPRAEAGSYMPVFLAGEAWGHSVALAVGAPFYALSHQENHLWAGLHSAGGPRTGSFLGLHLSGGTTELVVVHLQDRLWVCDTVGKTSDLHAGQLVDRIGVRLGLPFPAGASLERLAESATKTLPIPSYHREGRVSFSGQETAAARFLGQAEPADIAHSVMHCIGRTVVKLIQYGVVQTGLQDVLMVGGVTANLYLRDLVRKSIPKVRFFFAEPAMSTDNAVGAALYAGVQTGAARLRRHFFRGNE